MKNKEYMLNLRPDDCYTVMNWLMHDYGIRYTNMRYAVCSWMESETIIGEWRHVPGYMTAGGDPVWCCPKCGGTEHVYGIEHPTGRRIICGQCGCFNLYTLDADASRRRRPEGFGDDGN